MKRLILLCFLAVACQPLFLPPIEDEKVTFIIPQPNDTLSEGLNTLWWESIEGATTYQLYVYRGNTNSPELLLLDSLVAQTTYEIDLKHGQHTIQIFGSNSSMTSETTQFSFWIDSNLYAPYQSETLTFTLDHVSDQNE